MSGFDPNNIIHVFLRRMDEKLDRIIEDVHDLKVRTTAIEQALVGVQRRLDRSDERIKRLEKRAGLVDDVFREAGEPFEGPEE